MQGSLVMGLATDKGFRFMEYSNIKDKKVVLKELKMQSSFRDTHVLDFGFAGKDYEGCLVVSTLDDFGEGQITLFNFQNQQRLKLVKVESVSHNLSQAAIAFI